MYIYWSYEFYIYSTSNICLFLLSVGPVVTHNSLFYLCVSCSLILSICLLKFFANLLRFDVRTCSPRKNLPTSCTSQKATRPLKSRPMDKIILGKLLLLSLAKASPSQRSLLFYPFPDLGFYNSGLYTSISNLIPHYNGSSLCFDCLLKTVIKTKALSHQRSYFPESVGNFRIKLPLGLVFLFHSWPQRISINFFQSHLFVWFLLFLNDWAF